MIYQFEKLNVDSLDTIKKYAALRPIYTCEGQSINQFIWASFYQTEFLVTERFLFFKMIISGEYATMMPFCKEEDILEAFTFMKTYFNEELKVPMKIYIADEKFTSIIRNYENFEDEFTVTPDRDCFDYIYSADKLRTLSGKSYHKKKNHLNSFLKTYEGRYEYKSLNCSYTPAVKNLYYEWRATKEDINRKDALAGEEEGVMRLFENCDKLNCRMGGVFVDGKLAAYSIGSYDSNLKCAFIHIEKGEANVKGVYNYINQQFLINEFPEATIVNREDDLGQEGLRKAKLSYRPIKLEEKFNIFQKEIRSDI